MKFGMVLSISAIKETDEGLNRKCKNLCSY